MDILELSIPPKCESSYLFQNPKPFLKWAGGKSQLIEQMSTLFPRELKNGAIKRYVEPFVGSGAVFLHIAQTYNVEEIFICDINEELILAYKTIQRDVEGLINYLAEIQNQYYRHSPDEQENFFYVMRSKFNNSRAYLDFANYQPEWIERTAQLIFLNRTCFNGLFRVNSKAEFNVPFGRYKNPQICNPDNLRAVAGILYRTKIYNDDFEKFQDIVDVNTFVYFDPPYRPISKTASFTSYSKDNFTDRDQKRLAELFRNFDTRGAKLMLSNSDPKNEDPNDDFFEQLYKGFQIHRVTATRMINCDATKRGRINELIITNYEGDK